MPIKNPKAVFIGTDFGIGSETSKIIVNEKYIDDLETLTKNIKRKTLNDVISDPSKILEEIKI